MITVMVAKAVGDTFFEGGLADQLIKLNGFPYLSKEEHSFNVPVSVVMTRDLTVLPSSGINLDVLERLIAETEYKVFPVVSSMRDMHVDGYITRAELVFGINKARADKDPISSAICHFDLKHTTGLFCGATFIHFGRYIDPAPVLVTPHTMLDTVMDVFKRLGPRMVLVEQEGKLVGLVTRKDVLKVEHLHERYEPPPSTRPSGDTTVEEIELDVLH
jgi:chloride channel 3/4/5